jgi:hypothetical protein
MSKPKPMITITDSSKGPNRVDLKVDGGKTVTVDNHPGRVADAIHRINTGK